jgi:DNA-binding response OmpR family regulator
MDVVLVRWPADADRRDRLRETSAPRLLLIEEGYPPPSPDDCLEDWIRVPANDGDVRARMIALEARVARHVREVPVIDADGVLRVADRWVALPPVEVRLTGALLDRFGAVVSREALLRAGWMASAPNRNVLDVHMLRLRKRVVSVGLTIKTVRSRGYVLEASDRRQEHARHA